MPTDTKKFTSKKEADVFAREMSKNPNVSSVVTKPSGEAVVYYKPAVSRDLRQKSLAESEAVLKAQLESRDLTTEQRKATELELGTVQTSLGREGETMALIVYPPSKTASIATAEYHKNKIESALAMAEKAGYKIDPDTKSALIKEAEQDPQHKLFFARESAGGLEVGFKPAVKSDETSFSPEKALKMGLITEDQYNEAKTKNLIFIAKTSALLPPKEETIEDVKKKIEGGQVYVYIEVPQWVRKGLAKGVVTPDQVLKYSLQWGNNPQVTSDPNQIPEGSRVFRSDEITLKDGQLFVHSLPVWLEAKLESEYRLSWEKEKAVRKEYEELPTHKKAFVATRVALTDYGAPIELAILKLQKKTEEYDQKLNQVLMEQVEFERPFKEKKPNVWLHPALTKTFTRGVGLTAISAPLFMGMTASLNTVTTASKTLGGIISKALMATGVAGAGLMIYPYAKTKNWAVVGGEITVMLGAIAGGLHGSMVASKLRLGLPKQEVTLKPEKAVIRGEIQQDGKITYRSDTIDVKTNKGDIHDITYDGKIFKNSKYYHQYDIPEQSINTPDGDRIIIRHQKIYINEVDYLKIQSSIRNPETHQKLTYSQARRLSLEDQLIDDKTFKNFEKIITLSEKGIKELTYTDVTGGVTKFKRMGLTGEPEAYTEAGVSTKKGIMAKGIASKPDYTYEYYVVEKRIQPTSKTALDSFNRANDNIGQATKTSAVNTETAVDTALAQLEKARLLSGANIEASVNTGNVGRITGIGVTGATKGYPKGKKTEQIQEFMGMVDTAINQAVGVTRIKKKEQEKEYLLPHGRPAQVSGASVKERGRGDVYTGQGSAIDLAQRQVAEKIQAQLQKQEQKTAQALKTALIRTIGTGRISLRETPIEIKRTGRIPPFWWDYYANLGGANKALDTSLRTIKHKLIEASKLI